MGNAKGFPSIDLECAKHSLEPILVDLVRDAGYPSMMKTDFRASDIFRLANFRFLVLWTTFENTVALGNSRTFKNTENKVFSVGSS